ncbi:hypothetical protein RSOLAG1IB_10038 [Rhizoctonia solani AG-1 IB]|uniref:Uncharacterized protein n=1 Tax=Thanatephorus cucumeris (strain AG1-IB / isolate 7/3/14) TaxID=1108050 RepID=A0A0B7FU18_THACB|nr:hypothetical protein RSOLAG1IB_10038 [Rhizoctonia solani AG-1 IB]
MFSLPQLPRGRRLMPFPVMAPVQGHLIQWQCWLSLVRLSCVIAMETLALLSWRTIIYYHQGNSPFWLVLWFIAAANDTFMRTSPD